MKKKSLAQKYKWPETCNDTKDTKKRSYKLGWVDDPNHGIKAFNKLIYRL